MVSKCSLLKHTLLGMTLLGHRSYGQKEGKVGLGAYI